MENTPTTKWISLQNASALTQKPERTLRHQLTNKKIIGKKEGKNWLIDLKSLYESGQIKGCAPPLNSTLNSATEINKSRSKRKTPKDFGVFKDNVEKAASLRLKAKWASSQRFAERAKLV